MSTLTKAVKFADSRRIALCGYLSTVNKWNALSHQWNAYLYSHSLPPLHMKDAMAFEEQWRPKRQEWGEHAAAIRNEHVMALAETAARQTLCCVGMAVDVDHYKSIVPTDASKDFRNPYYFAFLSVIQQAMSRLNRFSRTATLSIIMDDEEEYAITCYKLLNKIKLHHPEFRQRINAIGFVDDEQYPSVQLADMLAWVTRNELMLKLEDPDREPTPLYAALTINSDNDQPQFIDASAQDAIFKLLGIPRRSDG